MKNEFLRGAQANLPLGFSAAAYGSVLGILAAQKGLLWTDIMFMNSAIFAGSAQFVMVDMWGVNLPVIEMVLAAWVINLRYLLIGASLESLFAGKSLAHKMCMSHLVADENWAVTVAEQRKGSATTWFLLGGGVLLYCFWSVGTLVGLLGGGFIAHPEKYALDFAFTAVFTALAMMMWQGKKDMLPWAVAGVLALVSEHFLPGKWYIVIGGIGGSLAAMLGPNTEEVEGDHA